VSGVIFYGIVFIVSSYTCTRRTSRIKKLGLDLLVIVPLIYIASVPVGMLLKSAKLGGFDFFVNERVLQYIYIEGVAIIILTISALLYSKSRDLYTGKIFSNTLSFLSMSFYVRLFWMIVFETRHLSNFAVNLPYLKIEYVVLISIPLFIALFILTVLRNLLGYTVSLIAGFLHIVLVISLVVMKINPGFGPIIVTISSLGICIFSLRGIREYDSVNKVKVPTLFRFVVKDKLLSE
jgi:hypothetical protein